MTEELKCTCKRDPFDIGPHMNPQCPFFEVPNKFKYCPHCKRLIEGNYCKVCDANVY